MSKSDIPIYGVDKELAEKQAFKYDVQREQQARIWIQEVLNDQSIFSSGDFHETLKDGVILARLINVLLPGHCKVQQSQMPFKQMENINNFLGGAEKLGVPKNDLFQTVDLYERKNPLQVVDTIFAVSRHAQKNSPIGSQLPIIGPKLADKREIRFSEEQMNAGKFVPSQQTGFVAAKLAQERGATGSGINYGLGRQISDGRVGSGDTVLPSQQSGFYAAVQATERGATASGINYGARREIGGNDPAKQ